MTKTEFKYHRTFRGMALVFILLLPLHSEAQLDITVSGGIVRGIPTAIVPFKTIDGTEPATAVEQVIAADLSASGKFEPMQAERFVSFPSRPEEVRFKDWRFVDAEALVIGEIWKLGDDLYEVQFHIYDVAREQEIGSGKRIANLRERDLRSAAHIISDNVYQAFTGRSGAFNSRIAYVKRAEIEYQRFRYRIMVADWDGFGEQEVFASWRPILSPAWSPDSRKLAFVSFTTGGPAVQVLDLASGRHETIAGFKGVNAAPAWSPDGTRVAYSTSRHGSADVYIYNTLTKQHTRVTTHYGIDTEPAWSPDGRNLLFTSSRTGKPQIYRHDLDTGETLRMTFEGNENANGSYDAEGSRIAMVHDGGQIVVMQAENGQITWLSRAKFDESPSFSPNGDMVLYATEEDYEPALMVASSDGRVRTRLNFISGDVREPAWSPLKY
ncbi:MAG: Tol-Pal system beta propeller repeat protein TolB [Gammaproteobacteria bacterium]|nr:Tol-Pal system beta propeller repeat protein TolB [Gammaproteobacteria bacterium]